MLRGSLIEATGKIVKKVPLVSDIARFCYAKLQRMSAGRVVTKKVNGIWYELDLSEMIDYSLYLYGYYEKETSRVLREQIRPEMTVVEVGANVGSHTFEIAKMLDPAKGRIICFEPTEFAFNKLKKNHSLNSFTNITLERVALSDTNETKTIERSTTPETMPFKASWDKTSGSAKHASVDQITFRRLDDYFVEERLDKLDLFKIDVDGYELRVLEGAKEILTKYAPVMIIELGVTVERVGDRLEDLVDTLYTLSYVPHSIETGEVLDREELIETVRRNTTQDVLCLPRAQPA